MTGTELREAWTCGSCGVTSRNPRIGAVPMPGQWDRDSDGRPRCVACSREGKGLDPRDAKRARRQRASAAAHQKKRLEREEAIADALLLGEKVEVEASDIDDEGAAEIFKVADLIDELALAVDQGLEVDHAKAAQKGDGA